MLMYDPITEKVLQPGVNDLWESVIVLLGGLLWLDNLHLFPHPVFYLPWSPLACFPQVFI